MPKPFFSGRIPSSLLKKIEERISQTGESKSQILIKALASYLDWSTGTEPTVTGEEAAQMLSNLEHRIAILEGLIKTLQPTPDNTTVSRMEAPEEKRVQLTAMIEPRQLSIDPLNDIFDRHYGNGKKANARVKH
jgi:hypothetical protein